MTFVTIDSYTKWIEFLATHSITTMCDYHTSSKFLRHVFAHFGLPETIISDNCSAFDSETFGNFLRHNGIDLKHGAPFSPKSNRAAENAIPSIKRNLKTALRDSCVLDLDMILNRFLLDYRNTLHIPL